VTAPVDDLAYALTWVADITEQAAPAASLPQAAAYYASIGWPVFPLVPNDKRPLIKRAHEPGDPCRGECGMLGHGLWDGTVDAAQVTSWWTQQPTANIGLRTGDIFDVIDVDVKDGRDGPGSFWQICEDTGMRPTLLGAALTPTGGRHLLIAPTGQGNLSGIREGVDYRGVGGYIVAPPSLIGGEPYRWVASPSAELLRAA
jgi:hypothetical protein